ncbi:MAG: transporter substrate-binding domain-containing protein [Actinomycetota bacterium]|nr:transporter substrate-binding domain-containing protein [Actinomycetota bacterium]
MSFTARAVASALLLCVGTACVPSAGQTLKVVHYGRGKTKMGDIQQVGKMTIGVPSDFYPFGYLNRSHKPAGFTVGLGKLVAEALGVKARFITRPSGQLLRLADSNRADLVFPMVPITQEAAAAHPFSDPYLLAHQRLLIPSGSGIHQVSDLNGKNVCSAIDPRTEIPLNRLDPQVRLLRVRSASRCVTALRKHRVAAATASDVALLGLKSRVHGSRIVGDQLTTEGYGAAVNTCAAGLAQFATRVFATAKSDGKWTKLYKRWVLPATGESSIPEPPTLTVNDAWDLFPLAPSPTASPVVCATPTPSP